MNTATNQPQSNQNSQKSPKGDLRSMPGGLDRETNSASGAGAQRSSAAQTRGNRNESEGRASGKVESRPDSRTEGKTEGKTDGHIQKSGSQEADAQSDKKSPTAVQQLDLAMVEASVSLGEIVKKIEALTPKEGVFGKIGKFSSEKLSKVQEYLGENTSKDVVTSAWQFLRTSPWPVGLALAGIGIGIYVQRSGKSENSARPATT